MRRFVEGADRGQRTLFPESLEDWIIEDNPVRVIDVFAKLVCSLRERDATGGNPVGEPKISSSRPGTRQQTILSGPRWCEDHDGSTKAAVTSEVGDPLMIRLFVGLAVIIWFFGASPRAAAQTLSAETGGVVIGRDVRNSTINIGTPPEELKALNKLYGDLSEAQKKLIAELEQKLSLNQRQVQAALTILGEANIPPEDLGWKLVEVAGRFKDLRATASPQPGDDPKIAALKIETSKAIEAGKLAEADALLARIEAEQTRALDRQAVDAAATRARRGEIALTRLRYAEAAKHFADAAAVFPPGSSYEAERMRYLYQEAQAYYQQGNEFGDNDAARTAIARYMRLIELSPRASMPLDWGLTQMNLGVALSILGERESETTRLEEAVVAYRAALEEITRARVPLDWAGTQMSLGIALSKLGTRESGTTRLEEAVVAYRAALEEHTRARVPFDWARTQVNLGIALVTLGTRESGTTRLEEAVVAYRAALEEITRARVPLDWALTQMNLGVALMTLGERESGTTRLEEAVVAYRAALEEITRARVPLQWALTQVNLGNALSALGERRAGRHDWRRRLLPIGRRWRNARARACRSTGPSRR